MRFAIATLGCKVNQYDSAIIDSRLGTLGLVRGELNEPADVTTSSIPLHRYRSRRH